MSTAAARTDSENGQGELCGRRALISSASRGVGLAIAHVFARAGAAVVMTGRDREGGEAAAREIAGAGGKAMFVRADPGSDDDWIRAVAAAEQAYGGVDILVANAGVSAATPTADMSLEEFRDVCRANLKGPFLGLKHATAAMRRGGDGGSVIMVGSVAAVSAVDPLPYAAANAGVAMLAKAAALELGPEKIRVNVIHPGLVETEAPTRLSLERRVAAPLGRVARSEEIGAAALFLASDRSIFMTGSQIVVDGGWMAR